MDQRNSQILPALIDQMLGSLEDADTAARIRAGLEAASTRPVTLRANALKATREDIASALEEADIRWKPVSWYGDAFVLDDPAVRERAVWELDAYASGALYLQSLSSMLPPLLFSTVPRADILDMCAAPGGKTSQLAALFANNSQAAQGGQEPRRGAHGSAHITACELSVPRAEKLEHNLAKLGAKNVSVMRTDARRLDEFFSFDQVLLDAPCTGSGTVRAGDAKACKRITPQLLGKVTRSQRALLDRALTVLKPGSELVYSTCSIFPEENEEQVMRALKRHRSCSLVPILGEHAVPSPSETELGEDASSRARVARAIASGDIPTIKNGLPGTVTVCPTQYYEGFFMALIKKDA